VHFESASVSGGTLSTVGTGRLVNASANNYSGITLSNSSVFDLNNNTSATFVGTFANEGTVNLLSAGNLTDFIAGTGGATLQGGGTIVLGNNANNRIYGITGSTTLVNQNNTLRGVGQIGVNQLQLDNRGLIEASVANGTLTLDTSGTSAVNSNTGTLQAANGGILRIESSALNNSGGTLHAATGSRVDLSNSTISGGSLTTAGTGVIRTVSGGSTLGGALTIASGAQLTIENNTSLTLLASGTYANSDTVSFASAGNFTDLIATGGDVTISGGGTLALGTNTNNRIYGSGGADRLVNAGGTIRGSGQIGVGLLGLVNQGTVKADQAAALTIDPSAAGVTNTGRLHAEAGATLRLSNGTFTNTNGIIEALGTGSVVEFNAATVTNGTLTSDAGAALRHTGGSTFNDITLSSGSSLELLNNTGAHFGGTLFNHATVALSSAGNFTDFMLGGNVTLDGGGTVSLGNNSNNRIYSDVTGSRLTNKNNTIQGSGQIGVGLMGLVNQSTIKANQPTALVIDPSSAGVTNTGLLRADSGATLQLQNGAVTNTGGTIEAFGAGSVVSFHSAAITSGLLRSSDGGVLRNTFSSSFADIFLTSGSTLQDSQQHRRDFHRHAHQRRCRPTALRRQLHRLPRGRRRCHAGRRRRGPRRERQQPHLQPQRHHHVDQSERVDPRCRPDRRRAHAPRQPRRDRCQPRRWHPHARSERERRGQHRPAHLQQRRHPPDSRRHLRQHRRLHHRRHRLARGSRIRRHHGRLHRRQHDPQHRRQLALRPQHRLRRERRDSQRHAAHAHRRHR